MCTAESDARGEAAARTCVAAETGGGPALLIPGQRIILLSVTWLTTDVNDEVENSRQAATLRLIPAVSATSSGKEDHLSPI